MTDDKSQLTREDLKGMTSLEVNKARLDGRLREAMANPDPNAPDNPYRTHSRVGSRQGKDFDRG